MKFFAIAFSLWALLSCATVTASGTANLVSLAEKFMTSYAQDLLRGDTAALARRYHTQGSYVLGNGQKSFESHEATIAYYRDLWKAPVAFEWQDLSYESIGTNDILVLGKFKWTAASGEEPRIYSYSALLVLVEGELRIRAEHESEADK